MAQEPVQQEVELYIVLYRKYGATEWQPTHRLFEQDETAMEDCDRRFEANKGYNRGQGYEYQACKLVPIYLSNKDNASEM